MLLLFVVFVCPAFGYVQSDTVVYGKLFGRGVCSIHREDTKQVLVLKTHLYTEMGYSLCWRLPFLCKTPTGRELKEFITIPQDIQHEILSLKCCSGYYPDKDNLFCLPICSKLCLPDKCLGPNNCSECQTGYHGAACVKDIPSNVTTTTSSTPVCECPNDNYMCTSELKCVCASGFDGPSCQHIIPAHRIIVSPDNCWFYAGKVGALIMTLAASAILIAILFKKRVCWSNTFEPLDDRNVPSV